MPALNLNTIRKNIEERLIAEMALAPPVECVFGNQSFNPTSNKSFILSI